MIASVQNNVHSGGSVEMFSSDTLQYIWSALR